jgi:DNA-binding NtrC family response regulator
MGTGMTTALIGKQGANAVKARVAVVTLGGASGMTAVLQRSGHEVCEFADWATACSAIESARHDLVLFDDGVASDLPQLRVPTIHVTERHVRTPRSPGGVIPAAAFEQIIDSFLALAVDLNIHATRCAELEQVVGGLTSGSALVGRSPIMRRLLGVIGRAADSDATVLIEGPAGSGKSLASRVLHCKSRRSSKPLVAVDAATLDGETMAATIDKARDTTLVLEDIDRLPTSGQSVLVKHLKERSGSRSDAGPRLVATTTAHLPELIARGAFREDLYYRLHAFPMVMPALRERIEDIASIAEAVLVRGAASGKAFGGFTPAARHLLESMPWQGNIAQLEAVVRRAQALAGGAAIDREHLVAPAATSSAVTGHATTRLEPAAKGDDEVSEDAVRPFEEEEQLMLSRALRATKGNVRRAAQLLGIGRATLYRKIQQYKLRLQ